MIGFILLGGGVITLGGIVVLIVAALRRATGKPTIWVPLVLIFAPIVALVALAVSAQGYWLLARTTVDDVESMIETNLPIGSSEEDVLSFLDERGIEHDDVTVAGPDVGTTLREAGYGEGTVYVVAILRDTTRAWFSTADIAITLIFNEDGRLIDYITKEWITSL